MPDKAPGIAVPDRVDPTGEWFRFWHGYLHADDDPRFRATWERAFKIGQQVGHQQTKYWAGLVPLLEDLLAVERELAIERAGERWALSNANAEEHALVDEQEEMPF